MSTGLVGRVMRVQYDREVDILTVKLSQTMPAKAIEVAPGVILALAPHGIPVYLEIHAASSLYDEDALKDCDIDTWQSLGNIAKEYSIAPEHLRRMARSGKMKAKKMGRRWLTTPALVEECMEIVSSTEGADGGETH